MKSLNMQELIIINQYVQGLKTLDEIINWFNTFEDVEKSDIIIRVWGLATQARVTEGDIETSRLVVGLKETHTPVKMMYSKKVPFKNRGFNLAKLIDKEQNQAFLLILNCFSNAEQRRKKRCETDNSNCKHWWHKDLSNTDVIKEVLKGSN